ncbi:VWA domain-containing protein [Knoellia aerolata]|uniref:VWA domain-containing protein n=1 Tax=Knoellia aerolata TaxID=442954 RepID=UPI001FDEE6F8|nr:VWA domain-containing protein [Knoellia aerolata]
MTTVLVLAVAGLGQSAASAAVSASGSATAPTRGATSTDAEPGKLLLMLDASGSMKAKDPSGLTKIEAAKKALTGVVGALPDTAQVGLRVYGATVDGKGKPTPAACADTQLVSPIGPLDKAGLTSSITAIKALGETPIAHSLDEALKDLGATGKRNIVLVSDGEESCVPDPCPSVKKLTAAGVDLQIDTVGFGVNATARAQLQCIADAGRGTYYDAKDAPALTASLSKLSQRALRPFAVSGTPVTAAPTPESAPTLAAGQYTDTFGVGGPARYYRIEREPGSTVRLSVAMRPPRYGDKWYEEVELKVTDTQGSRCTEDLENRLAAEGLLQVMVARVTVSGDGEDPCATGPLIASVTRGKNGVPEAPVEVLVMEEPPVESSDALPAATSAEAFTAPAAGGGSPVVGGGGFSDALTLDPGTYTEIVLPGEQIFYKVRVGHGQRAAFTVDAPAPGLPLPDFRGADAAMFEVTGWNPAREPFNHSSSKPPARSTFWGKAPAVANEFVPEVRYRNREGKALAVAPASIAGYYYFSLGREVERADSTANVPLTVRLRLAVDGEVNGEPAYAGPSPDASIAASASPTSADGTSVTGAADTEPGDDAGDDAGGWLLWVGLGLVAVLGGLGAAYTVVRTRLKGNRTEESRGAVSG